MSVETAGTVLAGVVSAGAAAISIRYAMRQDALAAKVESGKETADLDRAETEGWKTLIETSRRAFEEGQADLAVVRERLAVVEYETKGLVQAEKDCLERELRLRHEVDQLKGTMLKRRADDINRQDSEILRLRDEVGKLGDDVDEINRVGKRGQPGEQGPAGKKGPTGDKG